MADTIVAQASAPGRAGVAVIRVSGSKASETAEIFEFDLPRPRRAGLRCLRSAGEVVDEALVLWFPAGASFTGEPVLELQCHGSVAVVARLLSDLTGHPGFRIAEPGEFTRRALLAGRMDLTEVESLSDLLEAETETQRRQAMSGFLGGLRAAVDDWRQRLLSCQALLAASVDFADEDVPEDVTAGLASELSDLASELEEAASVAISAERVRDGFEVVLVGPPNVGKSTLLNRIAGREVALTFEVAGTTRDIIEVRLDLGGLAVTMLDTAGLRETTDEVESMGVARTRDRAAAADIRVFLGRAEASDLARAGDIFVSPMADIAPLGEDLPISGLTGLGVDVLLQRIQAELRERVPQTPVATRERHRRALEQGSMALRLAVSGLEEGSGEEVVAEDIAACVRALDGLIGRIGVEDILGEIFSNFCIGK